MSHRRRGVIAGAAGRDFHNFNVVYRDDPGSEVVAFTAAQIPGIAGRRYPAALAGPRYPEGIPILPEEELDALARSRAAVRAGEMQRKYNQRIEAAGARPLLVRTVPDFLVGAHAMLQCAGLITRDAGFFRDYFKGLKIIVPKAG